MRRTALIVTVMVGCMAATTRPAIDIEAIRAVLHYEMSVDHEVVSIAVPRDDLHVTIDGMDVPTAAGLSSRIWFYLCPCGRTRVIAELLVCDYEVDEVVAALHAEPTDAAYTDLRVDAIAPALSLEKPSLRLIRLHGEGDEATLARRVAAALDCTGAARNRKSTTMPATTSKKE